MCGIAGVVGPLSSEEGFDIVRRMTNSIVHRGPDDEGLWAGNGIAIGMRRLSIVDLAGGHQPMQSPRGTRIVFNGEIYNFRALRAELAASGYSFSSLCDTEVVLALYDRDGTECLKKLEGMFAIAICDERKGKLILARDRLGKKPLYVATLGNRVYFASEIKAILADPEIRPGINAEALYHYLTLRFVPGRKSIWNDIVRLPPGHYLELDLATMKQEEKRYWQVAFRSAPEASGSDYVAEFERLFLAAVEKRLVTADVPVGVLLSGGLDSSAVGAAAIELGHRRFHTFSVAFDEGGAFDETRYARSVARHIGSEHHEVIIGQQQFLDFLPEYVRYFDEPCADLASIPLYYVSKLAREHVKVVLSGEGSDEVLAGYDMEHVARNLDRMRVLGHIVPPPLLRLAARALRGERADLLRLLAAHGWAHVLAERPAHITLHWTDMDKASIWKDTAPAEPTADLIRQWYAETSSAHPIDMVQEVYCREWLVEDLLMKADKMSMAASLELRVPFLDHALVEWAAALPLAWKVGSRATGYVSKRILREYAKTRLPEEILTRPKQGFPVPAYAWLRGKLGNWAWDFLNEPGSRLKTYLDIAAAKPTMDAARLGNANAAHKIWLLVVAEQWMRAW